MPGARGWWRAALAFLAFALWGPVALVGLPLAGLLWLTRPRRFGEVLLPAALTGIGIWWLAIPGDAVAQVIRAWVVCYTAALLAATWWRPGRYLSRATLAVGTSLVATATLVAALGPPWAELTWLVQREIGHLWRQSLAWAGLDTPVAESVGASVGLFLAATMPATLILQSLAGGAIAWEVARRLNPAAPGEPLTRFRDFQFSDHAIWSVVLAVAVPVAGLLVPVAAWLKTAALNLAFVAGALYLIRGLAIAAAFLGAGGVSPVAVAVVAVASVLLTLPLLVIVPGLWVLGVSDTWLHFRGRLAGPPPIA